MLLPFFVSLRDANLQNENNLIFEVLTELTMKIPLTVIMTPVSKQKFIIVQEKHHPKLQWILIQVQDVSFQKRAVLIENESLQLGMLLTTIDSKKAVHVMQGPTDFPEI